VNEQRKPSGRPKRALVALTSLCVVAGVALIARSIPRGDGAAKENAAVQPEADSEQISNNREVFTLPATTGRTTLVVYFHGNIRCPTCLKIERTAEEVVKTRFGEALEGGTMQWAAINYDVPENELLAEELGIETPSLVVLEAENGRAARHRTFPETWDLIGDEAAFADYVRDGIARFLEETASAAVHIRPKPTGR
jgi:thiol-disulfide isomerase/thioredoxin